MRKSGRVRVSLALVAVLALAGCSDDARNSLPAPSTTTVSLERELSDRFWGRAISYTETRFHFNTIEGIVAGSHLIVRGRIGGQRMVGCAEPSAQSGQAFCEEPDRSFVLVAVLEVLKSDGRYATGPLLVKLDYGTIPDAELPNGELVLFLRNEGAFYVDEGIPLPSDSPRWEWYFPLTRYQGALRNLDGVVDVPEAPEGWWEQFGPFPNDVDGLPFEQVVAHIRELLAL